MDRRQLVLLLFRRGVRLMAAVLLLLLLLERLGVLLWVLGETSRSWGVSSYGREVKIGLSVSSWVELGRRGGSVIRVRGLGLDGGLSLWEGVLLMVRKVEDAGRVLWLVGIVAGGGGRAVGGLMLAEGRSRGVGALLRRR
jgi:hypothetical protein